MKGEALPKLSQVLTDPNTEWVRVRVRWYDGSEQELELASGQAGKRHGSLVPYWLASVACQVGSHPRPTRQQRAESLLLHRPELVGCGGSGQFYQEMD